MQNKFRENIDAQHASPELIEATLKKLHTPKKQRTAIYVFPMAVVAAALLFVCVNFLTPKDTLRYQQIDFTVMRDNVILDDEVDVQKVVLGEGILIIKSSEKKTETVAPPALVDGEKNYINEVAVYLGEMENVVSGKPSYVAAFSVSGKYYYFQSGDCEKESFEEYLKNFLEN